MQSLILLALLFSSCSHTETTTSTAEADVPAIDKSLENAPQEQDPFYFREVKELAAIAELQDTQLSPEALKAIQQFKKASKKTRDHQIHALFVMFDRDTDAVLVSYEEKKARKYLDFEKTKMIQQKLFEMKTKANLSHGVVVFTSASR